MPKIVRTIIPRIRRSLRDRGVMVSLCRSVLLPGHLLNEYRTAKALRALSHQSEFDLNYGVDTDGEYGGWTYLSDLNIASPNWFEGNNYLPIEPERFQRVLTSIGIPFQGYTFVDFGSGKGRALLLASEFSFNRILGLEFAPELHRIAEKNIGRYRSVSQKCADIRSLHLDFVHFELPQEPLVLFFFDPSRKQVLQQVLTRIGQQLPRNPHPLYVAYVAPRPEVERILTSSGFLKETFRSPDLNFVIYQRTA